MAFNERHHLQLGMFSMLIKEARRNAQLAVTDPLLDLPFYLGPRAADELIQKLTQQGPNRIYISVDGLVTRVLMWEGTNYPFETYIETFNLREHSMEAHNGTSPTMRREYFIAASPIEAEKEISFWNTRRGTKSDLLLAPDAVLESLHREGEFIHLLGEDQAYFRYHVSSMRGIRSLSLGFGDFRSDRNEKFRILPAVPPETRAYAYPFSTGLRHAG